MCEVNARYHLRENRVAFPGAAAHCVICSFHLPACAMLIKACNSWYLQKQSAATLICFIPSCIYQQLQGMLSLHFYFCTVKFSSMKLKKSACYCLPKSHIFPFKEHILFNILQSGTKVLRVVFHVRLPSKNKQHTRCSQSCMHLTKRTQSGLRMWTVGQRLPLHHQCTTRSMFWTRLLQYWSYKTAHKNGWTDFSLVVFWGLFRWKQEQGSALLFISLLWERYCRKKTILVNHRRFCKKKVSKKKNEVLLYDTWCKTYCGIWRNEEGA